MKILIFEISNVQENKKNKILNIKNKNKIRYYQQAIIKERKR